MEGSDTWKNWGMPGYMSQGWDSLDTLAKSGGDSPLYTLFCLNNSVLMWMETEEVDA